MEHLAGRRCSVCGADDERALVEVTLAGGAPATLCGSHALMHERSGCAQRSISELRASLGERRARSDRRQEGDELGTALAAAFNSEKRGAQRRGI
jgi:hypothetical protein